MKITYGQQSAETTVLVVLSWVVGALMMYYGITNIIPLVSTIVITSAILFKIFIYLMSTLIGAFILFYSILCVMQS
jgi:hypothetical protein